MNDTASSLLSDEESRFIRRYVEARHARLPVVFLSGEGRTDLVPLIEKLGSLEIIAVEPDREDQLDEDVNNALRILGFTPEHSSPASTLREFERAGSALRIIGGSLNRGLEQFLTHSLKDYSDQTPVDLVQKHGVSALEALANDLAYPAPA